MRCHMVEHGVKELAIPKIGCGIDKLKWNEVEARIRKVFEDTECCITVYRYEPPQTHVIDITSVVEALDPKVAADQVIEFTFKENMISRLFVNMCNCSSRPTISFKAPRQQITVRRK